jgi:CheY-like chemotaxis protein
MTQGQMTILQVSDTGPGIEPEDLDRIFQPFERGRARTDQQGTGIGLTICKLFTEILGGELVVDSQPGVGSTFRVKLHFEEIAGTEQALEARPDMTGYSGPRLKILVVDDDDSHRKLLLDLLGPLGFSVTMAATCAQAYQQGLTSKFDAVLLDVGLPDGSGWNVAKALRRLDPSPVIIMISANAFEAQHVPGPSAYCDRFLIKPFSVEHLLEQLRDTLRIQWTSTPGTPTPPQLMLQAREVPATLRWQLIEAARIGYADGVAQSLDAMPAHCEALCRQLRSWQQAFQFRRIAQLMEAAHEQA